MLVVFQAVIHILLAVSREAQVHSIDTPETPPKTSASAPHDYFSALSLSISLSLHHQALRFSGRRLLFRAFSGVSTVSHSLLRFSGSTVLLSGFSAVSMAAAHSNAVFTTSNVPNS